MPNFASDLHIQEGYLWKFCLVDMPGRRPGRTEISNKERCHGHQIRMTTRAPASNADGDEAHGDEVCRMNLGLILSKSDLTVH